MGPSAARTCSKAEVVIRGGSRPEAAFVTLVGKNKGVNLEITVFSLIFRLIS